MIFNPEESIDFHGFTGPFIQYTYARIKSILRKEGGNQSIALTTSLLPLEKELVVILEQFPNTIITAANELNPSALANYLFLLSKTFNAFYAELSVSNAETAEKKSLRLMIAQMTANVIESGMQLLGIQVPERM
jgi:arginyl-tRNA synthetase